MYLNPFSMLPMRGRTAKSAMRMATDAESLPTLTSFLSVASVSQYFLYMSRVNMVEALLLMAAMVEMMDAVRVAKKSPLMPVGIMLAMNQGIAWSGVLIALVKSADVNW